MPIYEILGISLASGQSCLVFLGRLQSSSQPLVLVTVVIISLWVFLERRKRFKASGRDVEDKGSQRTVDREKHRAIEGRDSSGVSDFALRFDDRFSSSLVRSPPPSTLSERRINLRGWFPRPVVIKTKILIGPVPRSPFRATLFPSPNPLGSIPLQDRS